MWVDVLLGKYLHSIPTNRLCADLNSLGAPIAPGTLAGGLQKLLPLFEPLRDALLDKRVAFFAIPEMGSHPISGAKN